MQFLSLSLPALDFHQMQFHWKEKRSRCSMQSIRRLGIFSNSVCVAVGVAVFGRRFIPGVRDRTKLSFKKYTQRLCTDTDMSVRDRILMVSNGSSLAPLCFLSFSGPESYRPCGNNCSLRPADTGADAND